VSHSIARRYSKALLELGVETGTLDTLVKEIDSAAQTYESSQELQDALANPLVPIEAKHAVIEEIAERLSVGQMTKNTLRMLVDRSRISLIGHIAQGLREMNDARRGLVRAEVTSAAPMIDTYYVRLTEQLERMTGQKIAIDRKVDPAILGGVVTRIGDMIYDGSLRSRLEAMRASLTQPL
jgi:F-type H+-transporting ATPase subunit delta